MRKKMWGITFWATLSPTHCKRRGLFLHLFTIDDTHTHSVRLLWTRDRPVSQNSTRQHTTITRDKHPWSWRDLNTQSQQESGRRPTP